MHERISAGQTSFIGADLSTLADCWRQLAPRRVSLLNSVLFDEPLAAVQSVLRSGDYRVETITHVFMRSEEHTSELQSLMRISYAVFCLKKKKKTIQQQQTHQMNYTKSKALRQDNE